VAWDAAEEKYWMPVDLYVGGSEHATLHLLYARFWHKVLYDAGLVSTPEPFQRLFHQGMIHKTSFQDEAGRYFYGDDVEQKHGGDWVIRETGQPVTARLEKMGKSKLNVVNPDDMCADYGADAMRLYELFMGPLEDGPEWETHGVAGTRRFLDRAWRLIVDQHTGERADKLVAGPVENRDVERTLHAATKKVTEAVENLRLNTAVSEMMIFVNEATKAPKISVEWAEQFVRILAPFAPHIAEELWERLGHQESLAYAPWPAFDEAKLKTDTITLAVQVSGKMRGTIEVAPDISEADAIAAAKNADTVRKFLEGKTIRREIYVAGRLVNIVAT
jgi:leucyl-tRNA synthetase